MPTVISADQVNPTDVVAMVAASAAVAVSDVPFDGPVGAVRVADVDGGLVVNPTFEQREKAGLEIVVAEPPLALPWSREALRRLPKSA